MFSDEIFFNNTFSDLELNHLKELNKILDENSESFSYHLPPIDKFVSTKEWMIINQKAISISKKMYDK